MNTSDKVIVDTQDSAKAGETEPGAVDLAGQAAVMAIDRPWLRAGFGPEGLLLYLSTKPDDAEEVAEAFLKVARTWNSRRELGLVWPPPSQSKRLS